MGCASRGAESGKSKTRSIVDTLSNYSDCDDYDHDHDSV
jgi:hypothetical protein